MNPKETAEYLVNKYSFIPVNIGYSYNDLLGIRKECALVTAYEIQGQYEIEHDAPAYLFWENVIKQLYELR
jgi:hypothetical protein